MDPSVSIFDFNFHQHFIILALFNIFISIFFGIALGSLLWPMQNMRGEPLWKGDFFVYSAEFSRKIYWNEHIAS